MESGPDALGCIEGFEGLGDGNKATPGLEPYFDQNLVATLGRGHALLDAGGHQIRARWKGDPEAIAAAAAAMIRQFGSPSITLAQANALLQQDLGPRAAQLSTILYGIGASQPQFDAMLSLLFNIGARAFSMSTVLARHRGGVAVNRQLDFGALERDAQVGHMGAGMEAAFGGWCHAAGAFDLGLFRRRMAEAMIYRGDGATAALHTAWAIK